MKDKNTCSFCGSSSSIDNPVIPGKDSCICRSCAETATILLSIYDESKFKVQDKKVKYNKFLHKDIKAHLDNYIIGNETPKKVLSVALYNHFKRLNSKERIDKSSILLVGSTGTGKTYLLSTLASYLDIPFATIDATSLTASGYVGEDVSSVLERLYRAAGNDVEKAQKGIVFIDEIDKIYAASDGIGKDIGGKSVQHELLKIIEGNKVKVHITKSTTVEIDTTNILFVVGGAFSDLRHRTDNSITALGSISKAANKKITFDDLVSYGMLPEFLGRFHIITELDELNEDTLVKILSEPKDNIISQYKKLFEIDGVKLEFSNNALKQIASRAIARKTGARALKSIVENIMLDYMYDIENHNEILIDDIDHIEIKNRI